MSNTKAEEEDRKQIYVRDVLWKLEAERQRLLFKDIVASDMIQEAIRVIRNLRARLTMYSKTLQAARTQIMVVHDGLEDEGDRVYLGSTNDADRVKEAFRELDDIHMNVYMSDGALPDVYASAREANRRLREAVFLTTEMINRIDISGASNGEEAQALKDAAIDAVSEAIGPVAIPNDLLAESLAHAVLEITYKNWRGETSLRRIVPQRIRFGTTQWHPEPQWLLVAWDFDKCAEREFALKDFGAAKREEGVTGLEGTDGPPATRSPS